MNAGGVIDVVVVVVIHVVPILFGSVVFVVIPTALSPRHHFQPLLFHTVCGAGSHCADTRTL